MSKTTVGSLPVSAFCADTILRVAADADLWSVAAALTTGDVGILVVGLDEVLGVVSERDVVHAVSERRDPATTTAADIAKHTMVWCDANASIASVAEEMSEHYVRHALVERDGKLVGIVSARDLLGAYASSDMTDPDDEEFDDDVDEDAQV